MKEIEILPLLRLVAGKPETVKVLEIKLEEPHLSFREVAAKSAMSSSQAHRLLNDASCSLLVVAYALGKRVSLLRTKLFYPHD